jgi:hypothetical protein
MSRIHYEICQSIKQLFSHDSTKAWLASENIQPGDCIVVNNSFVFRDVDTVKSSQYICLQFEQDKISDEPEILNDLKINSDLKRISANSLNNNNLITLENAVSNEMRNIGQIIFFLIGKLQDHIILTEEVKNKSIKLIIWDPSIGNNIQILQDIVKVGEVYDEEKLWQKIEKYFTTSNIVVPFGLREAIGVTLDNLQKKAIAEVEIPSFGSSIPQEGILDTIVNVLIEEKNNYHISLNKYLKKKDSFAYNEILRIAYNFSKDVTNLIRLIVSICDLKPIILWGTIAEHFALSEEFRQLPWTRSHDKPSLKNYEYIISNSRNRTFHNLFPFRKTLKVSLSNSAIQKPELLIFSEFGQKKNNKLSYHDKELVDILTKFTRAREQRVSDHFWQQNLKVMDAAIELFKKTSTFLKILHKEIIV